MNTILNINCDGGSRGNPGPAASAFTIYDSSQVLYEKGVYIGINTNNQAEYFGVIFAFKWLKDNLDKLKIYSHLNVYLDSLLIVNQLNGIYKIKDAGLKRLSQEVKELIMNMNNFEIKFIHIPREKNIRADEIVNKTLNEILFS